MEALTCPNCGAPLRNEYECEYCGTRFRQRVQYHELPAWQDHYYNHSISTISPTIPGRVIALPPDAMVEFLR